MSWLQLLGQAWSRHITPAAFTSQAPTAARVAGNSPPHSSAMRSMTIRCRTGIRVQPEETAWIDKCYDDSLRGFEKDYSTKRKRFEADETPAKKPNVKANIDA